jgi:hypothetical protein
MYNVDNFYPILVKKLAIFRYRTILQSSPCCKGIPIQQCGHVLFHFMVSTSIFCISVCKVFN